jgi:NAD(P)-dependent dehydrogenase (short-subunit alcohol dehydrogenase family)
MKLANKVALITGGNSGIGFATARLFVAEGARVAITGRNPKTLQAAAKELGDNVLTLQADVTDVEATERVLDIVNEQWGRMLFPEAVTFSVCPGLMSAEVLNGGLAECGIGGGL